MALKGLFMKDAVSRSALGCLVGRYEDIASGAISSSRYE